MKTPFTLLLCHSLISSFTLFSSAQEVPVRIMPVGDSITAGEHYKFPSMENREGYRRILYERLISEGYNVDFVGRTPHGERPKTDNHWFDWESEAYPGWTIPRITEKIVEALPLFRPDILLVHVGTNGKVWETKVSELGTFLDAIESFSIEAGYPITVILAKIINFFEKNSKDVTDYNIAVEDMLKQRNDRGIHIVVVDMENGAGLDYSDNDPDPSMGYPGGDMWGLKYPGIPRDKYHPNHRGFAKMAEVWHQALIGILEKDKRPFRSLPPSGGKN